MIPVKCINGRIVMEKKVSLYDVRCFYNLAWCHFFCPTKKRRMITLLLALCTGHVWQTPGESEWELHHLSVQQTTIDDVNKS